MTSQALNRPVDVLALFDAYIAHGIPQERPELQRARAAVAELIEAAKLGGDIPKRDGAEHAGMFFTATNAARLRTAIVAISGKA